MPETVWLNGKIFRRDEARISAFDAGLQHGVGLFETMLATNDRVFRLSQHLSRLAESARTLGLAESLRHSALAEAVESAVEQSELACADSRARVRLTLTGGDLNLLSSQRQAPVDPTILIAVTPATAYPPEMFDRGVAVLVSDTRANPFDPTAGHKTINYWNRLRSLQIAAGAGMGECLMLDTNNHLCGGAVSNAFLIQGNSLLTPVARGEESDDDLPSPVLPGITRGAIIEFALSMNLEVRRRRLEIDDVLEADEVFLTNASWGVLPVVRIEGHTVNSGAPGERTRALREQWLKAIRDEP